MWYTTISFSFGYSEYLIIKEISKNYHSELYICNFHNEAYFVLFKNRYVYRYNLLLAIILYRWL